MTSNRCPSCGTGNRPGASFCQRCGRSLVLLCAHCNTYNRPTAQFCVQCGFRLRSLVLQNRYRVQQPLARGGMGAVYLAEDIQLFGRSCVVKEMHTRHLSPAD